MELNVCHIGIIRRWKVDGPRQRSREETAPLGVPVVVKRRVKIRPHKDGEAATVPYVFFQIPRRSLIQLAYVERLNCAEPLQFFDGHIA